MPPDLQEVAQWVRKADHDRRLAEIALEESPPITDGAAFHCQQAAEKLLKAYLTWREHDFERTHDLRALTEQCAEYDATFLELLDSVMPLTSFAVRFRYPGPADPTPDDVRSALTVVSRLKAFVSSRLPAIEPEST